MGDVGVLSKEKECVCGRGGVLLDEIVGRTEDYVVTPDGRFVGRLDHLFKEAEKVRLAQIVQTNESMIEIRMVVDAGYSSADELEILREARSRLGNVIEIEFNYVKDIPRTRSGKFRFIVSEIDKKNAFGRNLDLSESMV